MLSCLFLLLAASPEDVKRVAAVVTEYRHNAHADVIASRLFQGDTLEEKGPYRDLRLDSVFTDQVPPNDTSRDFARRYGFRIADSVADALGKGGNPLAVDGVLLIAEHGKYPRSDTGQTVYPKRRLFEQVLAAFDRAGRVVPVFVDKHLADNWADGKWLYEQARERHIPLMAGSSLPTSWREPPDDVRPDRPLAEIVVLSYGALDAYGFHALEIAQCLAEKRKGGETGVARVRGISGPEVWKALESGDISKPLFEASLGALQRRPPRERSLADLVKEPTLYQVVYQDGIKTSVLTLNGAVGEWTAAWRYTGGDDAHASRFVTQEARPFMHFTYLLQGVERMIQTGKPSWPVERTLMTTGQLDAALSSRREGGGWRPTPELMFGYSSDWTWTQPPPAPPNRPINGP
jgi:hypothetical protein